MGSEVGYKNLIPANKQSKEEARANGSKGGKRSGEVRRQKADLRKAAQALLENTYTAKNGEKITGQEMLIRGLIANLADPKGRQWSKAVDTLITLTSAQRTKEQVQREKLEIEILQTKLKAIQGGSDEASGKLADLIDGLKEPLDDIYQETESADVAVADKPAETSQHT